MFDIQIQDHGSIVLISGVTPEGLAWLEKYLDPDAQRWCGAFAVEPRFVGPILDYAREDGLEVA